MRRSLSRVDLLLAAGVRRSAITTKALSACATLRVRV
jgi:hypothetical protein